MMLFTTASVTLRQVFDIPVLGVVDIMELSLVALIFIAMPGVFLRDENVIVDVVDQAVSARTTFVLRVAGLLLALVFLTLTFTQMIPQAMDKWNFSEVTMTLGINRFVHWVPIAFGFGVSILGTAWVLARLLRRGAPDGAPGAGREPVE